MRELFSSFLQMTHASLNKLFLLLKLTTDVISIEVLDGSHTDICERSNDVTSLHGYLSIMLKLEYRIAAHSLPVLLAHNAIFHK